MPTAPVFNGVEIAGTSSNRPKQAEHGFRYYDETLRQLLTWDANLKIWAGGDYYDGAAGAKVLFTDFRHGKPSFVTVTQGSDDLTAEAHVVSDVGEYTLTSGDANGAVTADAVVMDAALAWEGEENGGIEVRSRLKINAITSAYFYFGLHDRLASDAIEAPLILNASDAVVATATDGCGFVFDTDAGTDEIWCAGVSNGSVAAGSVSSGQAPVAATYLDLRMRLVSTTATFWIDGTQVASFASASRATIDLTPCLVIDTRTTTSRILTPDYLLAKPVNYPNV